MTKVKEPVIERAVNSPDLVRNSFLSYIKRGLQYQEVWVHPTTNVEFTSEQVKAALKSLKELNPLVYNALYILWTTRETRAFVGSRLMRSSSTVKRLWDEGIDIALVLLLLPDLTPNITKLYDSNL